MTTMHVVLCIFLVLGIYTKYGHLSPTFKIAVLVQTEAWPNVAPTSAAIDNGVVRLDMAGSSVGGRNVNDVTSKVCDLVSGGDLDGIILFVDCHTVEVLDHQSVFQYLTNLVVMKEHCYLPENNIFQLHLSCISTNSLLTDIAVNEAWYSIMLYHDGTFDSRCIIDLVKKLSVKSISTRIVNTDKTGFELSLKFLSRHDSHGVLVLGEQTTITQILLQARNDGLLRKPWVLMTGDSKVTLPNGTDIDSSNILFLRHYLADFETNDGHCLKISQPQTEYKAYLDYATSVLLDIFTRIVTQNNLTSLEPIDCHTQVQTRNTVMEATKTIYRQKETSMHLCSTKSNLNGSLQHMGSWTAQSGLTLESSNVYGNQFINFNGAKLKVAALPLAPYLYFDVDADNNTVVTGFCVDILVQIANKYNFSYEIVSPADNSYGSQEADGTWNGMVGMVMRSEADFAVGPFTITSARDTVIDFTTTYMEEGSGILVKRPQEEANKEYKVFKPLSVTVWIVIGVSIIIIGVLMFLLNKFSPFAQPFDGQPQSNKALMSISAWHIFSSFVEQGDDKRPSSASGRTLLGFWWVFTILIVSTYTANLAAYLTVKIIEPPIDTLDELANHETIKPFTFYGSNMQTLFQTSSSSVYQKIWNNMQGGPVVKDVDTALMYVKTQDYAFVSDHSLLEFIMLQDCQTLAIAEEKFNTAGLGFVLNENCNYLDAFNQAILKMSEAGLIEKYKDKWWPRSDSCTTSDSVGSAQSLGLDNLFGLFYFYFGVIGVAVVAFIIELLCRTKTCKQWFRSLKIKVAIARTRLSNMMSTKVKLLK